MSLSVLAVTSEPPWPLNSGGHLRTYHLLKRIARDHRVALIAPVSGAVEREVDSALRDAGIEPQLIARRRPGRLAQGTAAALAALQGEAYVMYRRHFRADVQAAIDRRGGGAAPDVVYLDHLDSFAYRVPEGATVVGDLHNVYSVLLARTADEAVSPVWRRYLAREARLLAEAEKRAVARADLVLTVSLNEQRYFRDLGSAVVEVVPNGVDCSRYADLPDGRSAGPPVVMFLGAMSWAPNITAAEFLAREVLPLLKRRVPDVRLRIVGRDPPARLRGLSLDPSIEVTGAVDDVQQYLASASILAVPLSAGGGTRLKILEAFAAGLPVVSTPVGCEGIEAIDGEHLVVADLTSFAEAVLTVIEAPREHVAFAVRARRLVREHYDWDAIGLTASKAILDASRRRQAARRDGPVSGLPVA